MIYKIAVVIVCAVGIVFGAHSFDIVEEVCNWLDDREAGRKHAGRRAL